MSAVQPTSADVTLPAATPIASVRPVVLPAPDRGIDLQVRVTAPLAGRDVPVVVFSHGFGESMDGYSPLAEFWAAHGFAVLQPTHLDSQSVGLAPDDPRTPLVWRSRIDDLTRVIDELDRLEAAIPGFDGRLDRERIAVAGHSWGATTASALLGARILAGDGAVGEDMSDARVRAGVLLAVAGTGGANLTPFAAEHFAFMNPDFARMATPSLIVAGDRDQSALSTRGPDWWEDAYALSPAGKTLLTLVGGEHTMGGIAGVSTHETTDWSPERVALVRVTTAYLRGALDRDEESWAQARAALGGDAHPLGRLVSK